MYVLIFLLNIDADLEDKRLKKNIIDAEEEEKFRITSTLIDFRSTVKLTYWFPMMRV